MSAFGNYEKDGIVYAIKALTEKEFELNKTPREIIASIMEATSYGIDDVLYGLRHQKVDVPNIPANSVAEGDPTQPKAE